MRLRSSMAMLALAALAGITPATARAQCCLSGLFSGLHSCCQPRAPVYAVAPIVAPPVAAVPAAPPPPPQPVTVPVQQVSYVPETCYRTEYQCVPQTCYRQICEIDPCTGCATPCMEPVTSYVQKPVNVPYTQYRAVTTTKYVQVQPGSPGYPAAAAAVAAPPAAASPFAAPTTPQAWAAAGADVPPTLTPQAQPTAPQQSFQQQFQQQIVPQSGSTPMPQTQPRPAGPQPTQPPSLTPAPSLKPTPGPSPTPALKPIPEMPRSKPKRENYDQENHDQNAQRGEAAALRPPASYGQGMPVVPGSGPNPATRAFPRLLEPSVHTTSTSPGQAAGGGWLGYQPAPPAAAATRRGVTGYPTALIPSPSPY